VNFWEQFQAALEEMQGRSCLAGFIQQMSAILAALDTANGWWSFGQESFLVRVGCCLQVEGFAAGQPFLFELICEVVERRALSQWSSGRASTPSAA